MDRKEWLVTAIKWRRETRYFRKRGKSHIHLPSLHKPPTHKIHNISTLTIKAVCYVNIPATLSMIKPEFSVF